MRIVAASLALALACAPAQAARVKDITNVLRARDNQLVGYGLVVGLQGSGDSLRNAIFTEQSLQSMLDRMGVQTKPGAMRVKNVAAVMVTADLPAFVTKGSRLDVNVSSLGDASSLMGGTLVMTPLTAPDGATYAVAQGQVIVSGLAAKGEAETLTQGVATAARLPGGAIVEKEPPPRLRGGPMALTLKNPDYRTATLIADAINARTKAIFGRALAQERDDRTVALSHPPRGSLTRFLAEIGSIEVTPDAPARIVVDARTGTIVIGEGVRVAPAAVTHGGVTVRVTETPQVSQPPAFSPGETTTVPRTEIDAAEKGGQFSLVDGSNLRTLVRGLNGVGVKPTGIIAILQALKSAGALQAELVVQ